MKIEISDALFTLTIQFDFTQSQCKEGASDVNVH